ncbi:tumor necrosis factor ligand superfamily member 14 [Xenopus laevis]|uniref:Tumor necrosis factor ligand superfamily member 14 n=1 Tax=Xenopus laevis TaxID=8355 RepID=A0A8J1MU39_XENLA|nr:tumor necrosis factor ligand superfamily member 14 [Xenopus laevis]OCT59418.1 hypothetical protein XELAEV_18000840mg [Xenopus laevis]
MDTYVQYPMSVFTVQGQVAPVAPTHQPLKKQNKIISQWAIHLAVMVLAVLALSAAAIEIYILRNLQRSLESTQEMMHENFEAQYTTKSGDTRSPPVPSAHVTDCKWTNQYTGPQLLWEPKQGSSFLHEIQYRNGSLLFNKTGIYFIYSKLQLRSVDCPKVDASTFFQHGVYKKSPHLQHATILMENKKQFCDSQGGKMWVGSSFLGGTFLIEQGEEVYVKMSNKELIQVKDGTITFFGTFML